jgi:hypothetical protein
MTGSRTVSLICKGSRANLPPQCRDPRFGIWGHGATAFPLCQLCHTGEAGPRPIAPLHTASLAVSLGANVLALARMLGHEDPGPTLKTYADLFDSDLDALADVLDQHRTAALRPSIANGDSETDEENVLSTLQQSA